MFPSTYYRSYYNNWYDRPSQMSSLLDDPFWGMRSPSMSSSLPYFMRPRRLSTIDNVVGGGDSTTNNSETSRNESVTKFNNTGDLAVADEKTGLGEMANQKDKFVVNIDVTHFAPHEIQVKVSDSFLIVEGNHDEKLDEQGGFVTRSFKRRYELPPDVNANGVVSDLNNDGILTITAPKLHIEPPKERVIPVQFATNGGGGGQPKGILKRKN